MKKHITLVSAAAVLAALATGCSDKKDQTSQHAMQAPVVEVAKPVKKMQEIWYSELADIQGEKYVDVRSRVSGYLESINFNDGDYVKAGDVLFKIDPRPFEAVVLECEARVKECEARITLARSNLLRAQELIKTNAVSGEVLETRKAEVLSAEAAILSAQAQLNEASLNLEFTSVKAPISGYVSNRTWDEGNLVNASTTSLTTIVSRDIIYAYFNINIPDFVRIKSNGIFKEIDTQNKKGPLARLVTDGGIEREGMITYIDNKLDTGSVLLRGEFKNSDDAIFPGVFGKIYFQSELPQEKVMVPELAVGTDLVGRFVYVVDAENTVKYVEVEVGKVIDGMQIIEKGLTGDELVIVNGLQRAAAGRKVSPKIVEIQQDAAAKKE